MDELHQAVEVSSGAQQVERALLLDAAVLHFAIASVGKRARSLNQLNQWKDCKKIEFKTKVSLHLKVMAKESGSPSLCRMRKAPSLGIRIR